MGKWEEIQEILVRAQVDQIDFSALNELERFNVQSHIATFLGRMYAKEDAVTNLAGKDVVNKLPEDILEDLQIYANSDFADDQFDEVGMARSFYHEIQMQLARLEGATGLDLTCPESFFAAYEAYWDMTLTIIRQLRNTKLENMDQEGQG